MRTSWPICLFAVVVVCLYQMGICRAISVHQHRSKRRNVGSGLPPTDVAQTNPCTETSPCDVPTSESNTADVVITSGATTTVSQTEPLTTERPTTTGAQTVTTSRDRRLTEGAPQNNTTENISTVEPSTNATNPENKTDPTTGSEIVTSEDATESFTAEPSGLPSTDVTQTDAVTTSSPGTTEGETVTSAVLTTDAFKGESSGAPTTDVTCNSCNSVTTVELTGAVTTTSPVTTVTSEDPTEDFTAEPSGLPSTDVIETDAVTTVAATTERPATEQTTTKKQESPCASSPCKNGGRCKVVGKFFWCRCRSKYAGRRCQIKVGYSKSKFREWLLKATFKDNVTEDTDLQLPDSDKDQWMSLRQTMTGKDPDANMDNNTAFFDRILVTNAYGRTNITDGNFLYQGDIVMNNNTLWLPNQEGTRNKRAVNAFEFLRWTKDEGIPYQFLSSLDDRTRGLILGAISEWERALPCIRWREKTDADINFVEFFQGQGCFSQVGRSGGRQQLSIGRGCEYHGIILHEMGHALGIFHEQSRPDRDDFVDVIKENVLEGFQFQFKKFNEDMINSYGVPYDYGSIMHYPSDAFTKEKGLETIRPRGKRDVKYGQRERLSEYDIKQARAMYDCAVTDFEATPVVTTTEKTIPTTAKQTTQPKAVTTQSTEAPTTKLTTTDAIETRPITTQASTIPVTPEIQTDPITTEELVITTQRITTVGETDAATTEKPGTKPATTEAKTVITEEPTEIKTDPTTTEELTTQTITTVAETDAVTTKRPTTEEATDATTKAEVVTTTEHVTTKRPTTEKATDATTTAEVVTTTEHASGLPPTDVIETDIATTEEITTQAITTVRQTDAVTTKRPTTKLATTEKATDATTTAEVVTTTEHASGLPPTDVIETDPVTTEEITTQAITTVRQTDAVTTKRPTTKLATTEKATDATTTAEVVTTTEHASGLPPTDVIETNPVTTEEITTQAITTVRQTDAVTTERPTTKPATTVKQVYCDIMSNCFKWIRKGYCSPSSPNYCYMKYFCRRTCEIWENSALSRGATCVDLLPECKPKAAKGQCSSLNDREYMENMCCVSCRSENCVDRDPSCPMWARTRGACNTYGYLKKYCKKSCNLCD